MKKVIWIVILLLIFILLGSYVFRNQLVKAVVQKGAEKSLGLNVKLGKVNLDFIGTKVEIRDFQIMNPEEYTQSVMFSMPEMYIDYNLKSIISGKVHLEEIRLNIEQLTAERNAQGDLNLSIFQPKQETQQKKTGPSPSEKTEESKPSRDMQIDLASIKLGKMVFKDYSQGEEPQVKELNVNLEQTYKDITDIQSLIMMFTQKVIMQSAFPGMEEDLGKIKESFSKEAQDAIKKFKDNIKIPSF